MQITVLAGLTALILSLPIHGLPFSTPLHILRRAPTMPSSIVTPNSRAVKTVEPRTSTSAVIGYANVPQRRHAAPLGSVCRNHAEDYPEYCDWVDPIDEDEEDDSITDDQLYNDDTGFNAR